MLSVRRLVFTDTQFTLLDGKYIIIRKLGQGTYGEVFLTQHINLNVYRAVKRIRKSQDRLQTGRHEADILKNLFHPSLPIIYDIDEDDVYFYIVEEYIDGESLRAYVSRQGCLPEKETAAIAVSICAVLDYMQGNGGICHLDIKPENIIVTSGGIKLLDFGSSLLAGSGHRYVTGTKGYAAPEMYHAGKLDVRCDIYAVGMLMSYMLAGTELSTPEQAHINCSENLNYIICKCISHDRECRYLLPSELISALEQSQKSYKTTKSPVIIKVYGSGSCVGTTHFAVMLASHFSGKGKCLLRLADVSKKAIDMLPLYASNRHIKCRAGLFCIDGIEVLPDYGGYAVPLTEEEYADYSYIVCDCGQAAALHGHAATEPAGCTVSLLVMGHTLREVLDYESASALLDEAGIRYITAVNFTDGREYTRIRKEQHIAKAFRIPYCVDPFSFVEKRGYLEKTILQESCMGENAGHRSCRSTVRLWRNTLRTFCRQLSVKCKRKKNGGM